MPYQYEIKGITLTMSEMNWITRFYEAACTAEWLMENYNIKDKDEALSLGYAARRLMNKYDYDEESAIEEVLSSQDEE